MNLNYKNNYAKTINIQTIINELKKNINFPYKKNYIKHDKQTLLKNLQKFKFELKQVEKYEINNINYFKSNLINSCFRHKYYQFINNDQENYENINILSDYFSEPCRILCKRYDTKYSPNDLWVNDKLLENLIIELIKKHQDINWINIRELIFQKKECANFKLTLALSIYKYFNATRILDISAGWGDRLIAAVAIESQIEYYHGFDPNQCMMPIYENIINELAINKTKFEIQNIPFETAKLKTTYNLIFTSPPFFDLEIYSQDHTQSINNNSTPTDWFANMLTVWLIIAWKQLEFGGYMVINLEDIIKKYGKEQRFVLYTEAMILFINGFFKYSKYLGVIGHTNMGRDLARPLWVWKKKKVSLKHQNKNNKQKDKAKYALKKYYPEYYTQINHK